MLWLDWLKYVWRSISANRLRSFLTALGIAIGIAAVSLLTAIGEGIRQYVTETFSQFGTNIIAIHPGRTLTSGIGGLLSTVRPLTVADALALNELSVVEAVVPVVSGVGDIEAKEFSRSTDVYGVSADAIEVWKLAMLSGDFLPKYDMETNRPFAVLGYKLKQELFPTESGLGEYVKIGTMRFRVIGVLQSKGQLLGIDLDDAIYIPAGLALQLFNRDSLMEIDLIYHENVSSRSIKTKIENFFRERHGILDVNITTQDDMLESLNNILITLTIAVGALGGISLFVGSVGISTIMMIAVRDRFHEIGLMRAIGATSRQILHLFLGEAIFLAFIGGLIGIIFMLGVMGLASMLIPQLPVKPDFLFISLALFLSAFIGLIAGALPAYRASQLDPIKALHAE